MDDDEPLNLAGSDDLLGIDDDTDDVSYTSSAGNDVPINYQGALTLSPEDRQRYWDLNYHEAAIYLQEGENNDKFTTHPSSQLALPAYLITHNTSFYVLDLLASLVLMGLALIEEPVVGQFEIHIAIPVAVELLCLLVIGLELAMRFRWLGPKIFCTHIRTMIKVVCSVIMVMEAITVMVRQKSHFRVTRALRPIFLLDTYYMRGVRRFVRQIIQSLPPILDMLILLLFFMMLFSILGFYLFASIPGDTYFQTFEDSFVSLFVLLTTANFPDVMMPAYSFSRFSSLFFIVYISLVLFLIMNILLAVVYDAFSNQEKQKLKKLWVHERLACQFAFKLLVNKQNPEKISLKHFAGFMKYYKPHAKRRDIYLVFKTMNISKTGLLSQREFFSVYEISQLKWKAYKNKNRVWSEDFKYPINVIFKGIHWFVTVKWFDRAIYLILVANFIWVIADTIELSIKNKDSPEPLYRKLDLRWSAILFVTVYVLEAILKILGLGPRRYFESGWNVFDFIVTILSLLGMILQLVNRNFASMMIFRPFRLLRLFKMKRRFRDVLGTIFILLNRMLSLTGVMLCLYYSFSIVGIELFSKYDMRNCCRNSSVESHYVYNNVTGEKGYYYLNSFSNILVSGVTLFELTVVNNWYIIMDGYVAVTSNWSRIYFMTFYLVTMVVMTAVVAFVLDAFMFRIQYRNKMHIEDMGDHARICHHVPLSPEELQMSRNSDMPWTGQYIHMQSGMPLVLPHQARGSTSEIGSMMSWFKGTKMRGKKEFSLKMYKDEVEDWLKEEAEARHHHMEEMREMNRPT